MKRMKLTTTLVCALTVLAFSATALAHDDYLDEDHIDDPENGKYVFWDEEEMMEFLDEYFANLAPTAEEDEGDEGLDSCTNYRPAAISAATYHTGRTPHWHVDTNLYWSSYYTSYYVCYNAHNHSNVFGIYANWRTTQSTACDYCDQDDWTPKYFAGGSSAAMTDTVSCWYDIYNPTHIIYYGREYNGYSSGYSFGYENMALFDRAGTSTDSKIMILLCI